MRAISATIDIAATPERVWAVLADLDSYPEEQYCRLIGLRAKRVSSTVGMAQPLFLL